jgi:alpha-tubulin suppressor-like RCC1 family protein
VYSWGQNQNGQLGLGDVNDRGFPTLVNTLQNIVQVASGDFHFLALHANGNVYAAGLNTV